MGGALRSSLLHSSSVWLRPQAQQPKKVSRIGYLSARDPAPDSARAREFGWLCASWLHRRTEYRHRVPICGGKARSRSRACGRVGASQGRYHRGSRRGPDWIQAAKNATKTIPIVMVGAGIDPVGAGLIESLARPGGNVTGITNLQRTRRETAGAAQRSSSETCPCRGSLRSGQSSPVYIEVKEVLPAAARALKLTVQPWEVRDCGRFREGIRRAKQAAPGWTLCRPPRAR